VQQLGAARAGSIVTMNTASVSSEVLGTSTDGSATVVPTSNGDNTTMGQTGLFGPAWFVVGAGLVGLGACVRRRSGRVA
jgi:hypothetical protein